MQLRCRQRLLTSLLVLLSTSSYCGLRASAEPLSGSIGVSSLAKHVHPGATALGETRILLAQARAEDQNGKGAQEEVPERSPQQPWRPGGSRRGDLPGKGGQQNGGMSDRIKKYMDGSEEDQSPGAARREKLRQKLMQMPEEERRQFIERMKQRRAAENARARRGGNDMPPGEGFMNGEGFGPGLKQGPPEGRPRQGPPGPRQGPPGGPRQGPPGWPRQGPPGGPRQAERPRQGPLGDGETQPEGPGLGSMGPGPGLKGERGPQRFPGQGQSRFKGDGTGPPGMGNADKGIRNFNRRMRGKWFGGPPLDLTVLNLSPEQKAKIQAMRKQNGPKARQIQGQIKQLRAELQDMMFDPASTREDIVSKRNEIRKLQTQAEELTLNDFLGMRDVLSKEQLQLLPQVRPAHGPPQRTAGAKPGDARPDDGRTMKEPQGGPEGQKNGSAPQSQLSDKANQAD